MPRVCAGEGSGRAGETPHALVQAANGEPLGLCSLSVLFLVKLKAGSLCPWHLSSPQLSCVLCGCAPMAQLYSAFLGQIG